MSAPDPRCQAALERLLASGAVRVHPSSVLPARDVLELSGESIRSRLCAFQDNAGGEFAMRPDMTTPIAMLLSEGAIGPGRHAYCGDVYRLPRTGRHDDVEFEQVGFEWFGENGPQADAEAFSEASAMVQATSVAATGIVVGDVGLFHAVADALEFSPDWRDRLKRSFARQRGPVALLEAAVGAGEVTSGSLRLGQALANLEPEATERAVEEALEVAGAPVFAGRSVRDIADRLISRAMSALPDTGSVERLKAYLEIRVGVSGVVDAVAAWAANAGVEIGASLDRLAQRNEAIAALAPEEWKAAEFDAGLGRRFAYYDGFAFEFSAGGRADAPVLSGGRYNGLIARIDPGQDVSAIGAALRADRLPDLGGGE